MNIGIIADLPRSCFSGGRYYSIMLSAALSEVCDNVYFFTNNPQNEIHESCFAYSNVKFLPYNEDVNEKLDFTIIFPHLGTVQEHQDFLYLAERHSKKVFLFSFETENWWNSCDVEKKSPDLWAPWKTISENVDGIVCVSNECMRWARPFYEKDEDFLMFGVEGPINSHIADKITGEKENKISFFTRIDPHGSHKGFKFLSALNQDFLKGYEVVVNMGGGVFLDNYVKNVFQNSFYKNEINLNFVSRLTEEEKFTLLKTSKLLFFPEEFTGFGLPPLEAAYCGTRSLCFDIPTVRENSNDLFYWMNQENMMERVKFALENHEFSEDEERTLEKVREKVNMKNYAKQFLSQICP